LELINEKTEGLKLEKLLKGDDRVKYFKFRLEIGEINKNKH